MDGFSQVFTGWYLAPAAGAAPAWTHVTADWRDPMVSVAGHHDENAKTLLNGTVLPASGTAEGDLAAALDNIFNHPNVGPFISRQLIERLVTSNSSPGYVYRVASVFNDDGTGVRGNLAAVVTAILTDFEARDPATAASGDFGKQREPIVRVANVLRAFHGASPAGIYAIYDTDDALGQTVLRAPSVFNFFSPAYVPPGKLAKHGLDAPEFQITSETTAISSANDLYSLIYNGLGSGANKISLDLSAVQALAGDPGQLTAYLNTLLLAGNMSAETQETLASTVAVIPANNPAERARSAVRIVATAPEFIIQK